MKSKLCASCTHWMDMSGQLQRPIGICDHPTVEGKILIDRQQSSSEDGTVIYTDKCFGCIYHAPVHGKVVARFTEPSKYDRAIVCPGCGTRNWYKNRHCVGCNFIFVW